MSETQQGRVTGLAGLIERWQQDTDYPISKAAHETDREVMEAVKTETRSCIRELDPFMERLKALETSWRQRAGGRTWTPPEPMISDAERKCADELHTLIYGEQPQQSSGPSGNAQDSVQSGSATQKTATKREPTEDVAPKRNC